MQEKKNVREPKEGLTKLEMGKERKKGKVGIFVREMQREGAQ